jgi:asparagine synthase (glutamine-hydrolysing)
LVPAWLKRNREASRTRWSQRDFLPVDFMRAIDLDSRVRRYDCSERYSDLAQWESCHYGNSGFAAHFRESDDIVSARGGIEERHPFWDRRLIEFAAAIPGYCHRREDQHKLLLRRSGERLLPAIVRDHSAHAEVGCVFVEALRHDEVRNAFASMQVADRGWVCKARVADVYKAVAGGRRGERGIPRDAYRLLWPLWMVFGIECWLRNRDCAVA